MQKGFYIDQTRCIGCYTCVVACKDWYDVPAGSASYMKVIGIEKGKYPNPWVAYLPRPCYHCAEPACLDACPVGAISKRKEDGIVVVDREACLGVDCGLCKDACPYGSPQFRADKSAKMEKCDMCIERWEEGKKPICVDACPMRALDAGPLEELRAKYEKPGKPSGFTYDEKLKPSVVFKPQVEPPGLE